jgi:K+/H+ antiporter YhaU regulatory subunit KhtT
LSFDLQWVVCGQDSTLVRRSIYAVAIRTSTGASVVGVICGDRLEPNPDADFKSIETTW